MPLSYGIRQEHESNPSRLLTDCKTQSMMIERTSRSNPVERIRPPSFSPPGFSQSACFGKVILAFPIENSLWNNEKLWDSPQDS